MPSELYLVDSSLWIEVLHPDRSQPDSRRRVDALLAADAVATMGLVKLEILSGARTEADYRRLERILSALHTLPVAEQRWDEAADLGFRLRRKGIIVPSTDLLIAVTALHEGARPEPFHRGGW